MNFIEQFMFLKVWATYLSTNQLSNIWTVLKRSPSNPSQLAFLLEITTQLCILKQFGQTINTVVGRPTLFPLANLIKLQQIKAVLTVQNIQKLINLHQSMHNMLDDSLKKPIISQVLIPILYIASNQEVGKGKNIRFKYFLSLGKYYYLVSNQSNIKNQSILQQIKQFWSLKTLIGDEWRQNFVDLLIIWSTKQAQIYYNNSFGQTKPTIQEQGQRLLYEWFDGIVNELTLSFINKEFLQAGLVKISLECKLIAKNYGLKNHKVKRTLLNQLKKKLFLWIKQKPKETFFGCIFTILNTLCLQLDQKIESIITLEDLIENEFIFYSYFWSLSNMDCLFYFPSFSAYMREFSQYSILEIYHKIDPNFKVALKFSISQKNIIYQMIQKQEKTIFQQFNIQPIILSKTILEYYLQNSGIPLPKAQKSYAGKNNRKKTINPIVPDPLHFIMIGSKFWQDSYHRKVLQIALWIILHFYCGWLQTQKFKEITQKQTQQYIKKLNLTVSVFFFSLNHPTHILQYLPIQGDCFKELFVQQIFPSLVLSTKYFFKSYDWDTQNIVPKIDAGLESWVLPWAHLLASPKNMLHFIYLQKGYELAYLLATQNKVGFQRIYGDFFVSRILSQLQGVGINLLNGQAQNKQKSSFIHPERKKYMILLLKESEKSTQKFGHTARKMLQILA